ncbi:hypothetical protein F5144DRAFT_593608 [Chaetomium tenue]|uniref:Uncharacterized protein n=1 Tax=Chaetomium tenue TaxID=1854479 RepID=A0ACB7P029_9PEZI|nr:hypothetical protein F5144DRAFT_593608 [Chaetomium globosum]
MIITIPRYHMHSFAISDDDDNDQWFSIEVQLNMAILKVLVSLSDFCNSPKQTWKFRQSHAVLRAKYNGDSTWLKHVPLSTCFDWVVFACVDAFSKALPTLRPLEIEKLTLGHFLVATNYLECRLHAINDLLGPGRVKRVEMDEHLPPAASPENPWTTAFPSYTPDEVAVIVKKEDQPFNWSPERVRIGQQDLYFRESINPDDENVKWQVKTHEQIARGDFRFDVPTCRLHGVVRNARGQLMGLLLYPDAKPDNVLMKVDGDTWVNECRGNRTKGWTVAGVCNWKALGDS